MRSCRPPAVRAEFPAYPRPATANCAPTRRMHPPLSRRRLPEAVAICTISWVMTQSRTTLRSSEAGLPANGRTANRQLADCEIGNWTISRIYGVSVNFQRRSIRLDNERDGQIVSMGNTGSSDPLRKCGRVSRLKVCALRPHTEEKGGRSSEQPPRHRTNRLPELRPGDTVDAQCGHAGLQPLQPHAATRWPENLTHT